MFRFKKINLNHSESFGSNRAVNTLHLGYKSQSVKAVLEIIAVCSKIHTRHINTLCVQNVELLHVKLLVSIVTTGL